MAGTINIKGATQRLGSGHGVSSFGMKVTIIAGSVIRTNSNKAGYEAAVTEIRNAMKMLQKKIYTLAPKDTGQMAEAWLGNDVVQIGVTDDKARDIKKGDVNLTEKIISSSDDSPTKGGFNLGNKQSAFYKKAHTLVASLVLPANQDLAFRSVIMNYGTGKNAKQSSRSLPGVRLRAQTYYSRDKGQRRLWEWCERHIFQARSQYKRKRSGTRSKRKGSVSPLVHSGKASIFWRILHKILREGIPTNPAYDNRYFIERAVEDPSVQQKMMNGVNKYINAVAIFAQNSMLPRVTNEGRFYQTTWRSASKYYRYGKNL